MYTKDIDLAIDYNKINLKKPKKDLKLTGFILKNYDEYCEDRKRPAVIICPGGGYEFTSEREATPVAMEFLAGGINAFVLYYSCAPAVFPTQLVQVATAIEYVRNHADEFHIDKDKIFVCGFSAGGHLAASSGVLSNCEELRSRGFCSDLHKPNGMILCYPVITTGNYAHRGSINNLLAENQTKELLELNSLEKQVNSSTPPCFIWHTFDDSSVPVQNSIDFAKALTDNNIPFELHIYPKGTHGLSLSNELVCVKETIQTKPQQWINLAKEWISKR